MKLKSFSAIICLCTTSTLLVGCSHMAAPYSSSLDNLNALKILSQQSKNHAKIKLGKFVSSNPKTSIMCRLDESETLPNGETYVQYIHHALKGELAYSNLLSKNSHTILNANLTQATFSSMGGTWTLAMNFNSNVGKPFSVRSIYHFRSNYIADKACDDVSESFIPAVQQFLRKLYKTPAFTKLLK